MRHQKILHSLKSKNDNVKYSGKGEWKQQKLLQCSRTLFVTRLIKENKYSTVIYKCLLVERIFKGVKNDYNYTLLCLNS